MYNRNYSGFDFEQALRIYLGIAKKSGLCADVTEN